MSSLTFSHTVTERFLRYVTIDTQSDPESPSSPSTEKQKDLGRVLAAELKAMGVEDAHLDDYGYVYGTIPANTDKKVPVICFCSHMDTSPDCSGKDVKPQLVKNYRGGDIVLPGDTNQVIRLAEHPALKNQIGNDIITSDGTTLLGADNKAGVAEIMDAAYFFINNPDVKHGTIKILFTPDEEIGRGVDNVDLKKLGADFGYTMDGESAGCVEDETFSADGATITINGVSAHPGYAKGKMVNAMRVASDLIMTLPQHRTPETTEKREGYLHPLTIEGNVSEAKIHFLVRDFSVDGLEELESVLKHAASFVARKYRDAKIDVEVKESYRNMKYAIEKDARVVAYAEEALTRAGITPRKHYIRGGTDGARLSFEGLLTPNLFDGSMNFHSKKEWTTLEWMEKATETILSVLDVWVEKSTNAK